MTTKMNKMNELLKKKLAKGVARFVYTKKDGTLREAVGTNNRKELDKLDVLFADAGVKLSENVVRYFDLDRMEFRSFLKENLVEVKD